MQIRSAKQLTALASVLFLVCFGACSSRTGLGLDNSSISITAVQLVQDYRTLGDGPGGADKKYKDKILEVSGAVLFIGNDFGNTIKVELSGGDGVPIGVTCWFEGDDKAPLTQVKKGQTMTIQGKCDGRTFSVLMRKCKLK
jgi:tRNA_anti-like